MNGSTRKALVGMGIVATILLGAGCMKTGQSGENGISTTSTTQRLTTFNLDQWAEHKGVYHYELVEPGSENVKPVKGCNYSYRFLKEWMRYEYGFGMSQEIPPEQECDSIFIIDSPSETEALPNSSLRISFVTDLSREEAVKEFEEIRHDTTSSISVIGQKQIYVDGRVAEVMVYDYTSRSWNDPKYSRRRAILSQIYDDAGTLFVRFDGYPGYEDLYQAILSTVRFH